MEFPGHITLNEEEWDRFMEAMQNPGKPTPAIMRGHEFLRKYRERHDELVAKTLGLKE